MSSSRGRFIAQAWTVVVATAAVIVAAPHVIAQPKVQWRISAAYPPVLDQLARNNCYPAGRKAAPTMLALVEDEGSPTWSAIHPEEA